MPERLGFTPFDPARKRTEATIERDGTVVTVLKGAPQVVAALVSGSDQKVVEAAVAQLAEHGYRVLAVAAGGEQALQLVGLIGLFDPPRLDSAALIANLHTLGVQTKMLTGDTTGTARAIAKEVGLVCPAAAPSTQGTRLDPDCDVFAGIFPEDKIHLVQALQAAQHVVSMTGDGVNDAPALKQAEVGIAVSSATDVAKAAASIVLTTPGLLDILAAVQTSRRVYQRMRTYTLNKIIKTIQVAGFLTCSFFLLHDFVITPTLIVLLLFANDFVTMSIAADHATPTLTPDRWHVGHLVGLALALAAVLLIESFLLLWLSLAVFQESLAQTQTLVFLMLVFSGQATVYVVRERGHFWSSLPGRPLLIASLCDLLIVSGLATVGILMTPVSLLLIGATFALALVFMLLLDQVKQWVVRRPDPLSRTRCAGEARHVQER